MRRLIALALLLLCVPARAAAQAAGIEECGHFKRQIDAIVKDVNPNNEDLALKLLDIDQGTRCFAVYAAGADRILFRDFVRRFESSRTDKQGGAAANASASTSIVAQGPVAKVLSVAAEYGALTQSANGQVVTIQGNLAGIPSALVRHNVFPYCVDRASNDYCVDDSILSLLRRASFAISFDSARGTEVTGTPTTPGSEDGAQPVTFNARRNQITSAKLHIDLWNRRDTTSEDFLDKWKAQVGGALDKFAGDLLASAGTFHDSVANSPHFPIWQAEHVKRIKQAGRNRTLLVAALRDALEALLPIVKAEVPELEAQAAAALAGYSRFFLEQRALIDTLATKPVWAVEFAVSRPNGKPNTSNARFIVDWPLTPRLKVVANASFTRYDSLPADAPANMSRYRDAQVGAQLDRALGDVAILGPATVSAGFYYQYQHAPALLEVDPLNPVPGVSFIDLPETATTVFAEKGDIILFQAKLTLTPDGSSIRVPVAVTYSNRTELIDKPAWRAQVGVTYDFDSLFARPN